MLRYLYVLALIVWLGGMAVLGAVVAPTIFQVLQASAPETGRALAGAAFAAMLARFHYVAYLAGAIMFVSLTAMAVLGPRPAKFAVRMGIITAMLAIALYSGLGVLREIDGIQAAVGTLPSRLAPDDARRIRFDGLHVLSTRLMSFNILLALTLVFWEARER